jgi:hypothetical protein
MASERGFEGAEETMTDEEQLGEQKQPTERPRLRYEEGLKRIWVVLSVCWVGFWLIFPVLAILQEGLRHEGLGLATILQEGLRREFRVWLLGGPRYPVGLGLCLFVSSCSLDHRGLHEQAVTGRAA